MAVCLRCGLTLTLKTAHFNGDLDFDIQPRPGHGPRALNSFNKANSIGYLWSKYEWFMRYTSLEKFNQNLQALCLHVLC